jgi:hypothetical protein
MRLFRRTFRVAVPCAVVLGVAVLSGCQGSGSRRVASAEPALSNPVDGGTVVEAPPKAAQTVTWADRHPLFSKPRQYYDNAGTNKVVKAAAATVIGIPAGLVGEIKQIVVGTPAELRY